jgi:hypothetical protein
MTEDDSNKGYIQEQIPSLDIEPVSNTAQASESYPGLIKHLLIKQRTDPLKPESKSVERDRAVMKFSGWIPESEREKNFFMDGSAERMRRAHHTRNGSPTKAVRGTYETLVDFRREAFSKLQILDKAVINPSGEKPEPDPELIRTLLVSDLQFRGVFVDYFLSREIFNAQENPNKKTRLKRREDIEKIVMADVHMAFGGSLKEMQTAITEQMVKRANAWAKQLATVREFDYVREDHSDEASEQIGHLVIEHSLGEALPHDVKEQQAESVSPRHQAQIDTLEQQQGGFYASKKSVLGAQAPKTAEEIEREEVAKIVKDSAIKRLEGPPKPKKTYKRGWPETGPSAKRVETD